MTDAYIEEEIRVEIDRRNAERDRRDRLFWQYEAALVAIAQGHEKPVERVEKRILLEAFGLTQTEVWYLLALWRAKGRVVDPYWLLDNRPIRSLDEDKQSNPLNVVRVYMFKLRRKLGAECFKSMRDEGYMLTPEGLAKIHKVISFGEDYDQDRA